ncbi:MAG: hypothetical protein EXS12_03745 [Phycisphaerales bacterium]|nr:hypothetical protein [Phycisphaerales bacterium]
MQRITSPLLLAAVLASSFMMALAGCTAGATYPPTSGKTILSPSTPPCPQVMANGLRYAQLRLATPGEILVFNLPPQTPQFVWDDVATKLGDGSRAMTESDKVGTTLQQLRLNGSHAEVDVIYVTSDGVWQMATVHLEGAFGAEYRPSFVQRWLIPVEKPVFNPPRTGILIEAPEAPVASPIIPKTQTGDEPKASSSGH